MTLLLRAHLRHLWRERWQAVLAVFGIAVGVAVVLAVDLANASSREAMRVAGERLDGTATHAITGPGERLAEHHYAELRLRWRSGDPLFADVRAMAPLVTAEIRVFGSHAAAVGDVPSGTNGGSRGWPVQLLGVDPAADAGMRAAVPGVAGGGGRLMSEPGAVLLDRDAARRIGVASDTETPIWIRSGGRVVEVTVLGTFAADGSAEGPALGQGLMVADIATAQELLGRVGVLSRIDLQRESPSPANFTGRLLERIFPGLVVSPGLEVTDAPEAGDGGGLAAGLGPGLRLESLAERAADTRGLAASFQLNLAALGLLALFVGLFLVHGTLAYAVLRRQRQFGRLRALGVRPGELKRMVLAEAAVLGIAGTLLGLVLGRWLASGLLGLISGTLEGLYGQVAVAALAFDVVPPIKAALVGLAGTLLAALPAARRAAEAAPLLLLGNALTRTSRPKARLSGALALVGFGLLCLLPGTGYLGGLLAVGGFLLAAALLTPLLVGRLLSAVERVLAKGPLRWRMLMREAVRGLARSGVATAALVVALATAVGMGLMVESFRGSVDSWLEARLAAPLHVQLPGEHSGVPAALAEVLDDAAVSGRVERVTWDDRVHGQPVRVSRVQRWGEVPPDLGLSLLAGRFDAQGVLLSEPLARRLNVGPGAHLEVPVLSGSRSLPVAGVFREYGAGPGLLLIPAETGVEPLPAMLTLELHGVQSAAIERLIPALAAAGPEGTRVRRNDELLTLARGVFDRTFRVTGVLQSIAGMVAAFGLFGALTALGLERRVQYGVLRTLGVGRSAPAWQNLAEALLLAAAAALVALPLGAVVAVILVEVVNVRAFGWSLDLHFPPWIFIQALVVALVAGAAAAVLPAWSIWRTPPGTLLAETRAHA